jgi:hypothetical protein
MPPEPVVVVICRAESAPRRAVLADVLVVEAGGQAAGCVSTDLFLRYPGLAMVVIPDAVGGPHAWLRDGTMLALRLPAGTQRHPDWMSAVVRTAYLSWAAGCPAASAPREQPATSPARE